MTTTLALREVAATDRDLLAALHGACFDDPWDAAAMADILAMPGTFGWIALDGPHPAGFVLCRVAADEVEILSVGVIPDRRGEGSGRRLLAAALDGAVARGAKAMALEVAADNAAARALYDGAGFVKVGARPRYYQRHNGPVDAETWRRDWIR